MGVPNTAGALRAREVADVPRWVNGDPPRAPKLIALGVAAAISLNVSLLVMRLATV